jgi:uncharacterized RDD family membrane protein YckC
VITGVPHSLPPRSPRTLRTLVWTLAIALLMTPALISGPALAQLAAPGNGPLEMVFGPAGHGWMVFSNRRTNTSVLAHLPPRTSAGRTSTGGDVLRAPGVNAVVERAASSDHRVYLALGDERRDATHRQRRVLMVSAVARPGGGWDYPPGRPEVLPSLPGQPDLLGFAAGRAGPVALLRERLRSGMGAAEIAAATPGNGAMAGTGPWQLLIMEGQGWTAIPFPWEGSEPSASPPDATTLVFLLSDPAGVSLFTHARGETVARRWSLSIRPRVPVKEQQLRWTLTRLPVESGGPSADPERVLLIDGEVTALRREGRTLRAAVLRPSGPIELPPIENVGEDYQASGLSASPVLAVLWTRPVERRSGGMPGNTLGASQASGGREGPRIYELREVSISTGRTLFSGPVDGTGPISAREFRILAGLLIAVFALVIVFVLRSDGGVPSLPKGVQLGEPMRRLTAALLDYVPASIVTALLLDLPAFSLVGPASILTGQVELWHLLAALGLTCVHCAIGEGISGRSLGKMITGCQVVSLRGAAGEGTHSIARPAWWQIVVRNVVKWSLPVAAVALLFDASRRHAGDVLARTIVVTPETPDEE